MSKLPSPPYALVYYKKRQVFLPIPYSLPEGDKEFAQTTWSQEGVPEYKILDPVQLSDKEIRDICRLNDISYYWVTGKKDSTSSRNSYPVRRKTVERGGVPLTSKEFKKFRDSLRRIDKQSFVIANLIWRLNRELVHAGAFITMDEVLRIKEDDLRYDKNMVNLYRSAHGTTNMVSMSIPEGLFKSVVRLINPKNLFIFANRYGGPLSAKQVIKHFRAAGKLAKIRSGDKYFELTPGLLRPVYDASSKGVRDYQKRFSRHYFMPTEAHLDHLLSVLPRSPKNAGSKSIYGHRDLLRAIVYRLQTGCKWGDLPEQFPSWVAVSAQFQRWKRCGFIKEVMSFLSATVSKDQI